MKDWFRRRPWIWIVLLFLAVLAVNLAVLLIASEDPPVPVG